MERSLFRYIIHHTWRDQVLLLVVTAISFPLIYINLEIPKRIVNQAIGGKNIPATFLGFDVTQISYLMALSVLLLALITINGAIKYWLNVFRGIVGERTMRRLRHDLYEKVLRFPLPQFKTMSAGEIIPMIVSETEPVGNFIGESINLPVFQGGLLVTYLVFIFNQNPWLGLAAVALYPPQMYLIPRLQRKINSLSKERVQTARALSDRIGESVAGSAEIRGNDTFHLEAADISDRLGTIFGIRVDIYKRKFFVKFLNNFLAQVTPFFFYSVGGYFVIKGELSLGALVAVLGAYKDILDPWKELLAWYSTKEDVRIKYEQIVSQFEPPGLIDSKLISDPVAKVPPLAGEIAATGLRLQRGRRHQPGRSGFVRHSSRRARRAGRRRPQRQGRHRAPRCAPHLSERRSRRRGRNQLRRRASGDSRPAHRLRDAERTHLLGNARAQPLLWPQAPTGRRRPSTTKPGARAQQARVRDALAAGNSPHDIRADWIDYEAAGVRDAGELTETALAVLRLVDLERGGDALRPREHGGSAGRSGLRARRRWRRAHECSERVQQREPRVVRRALRSRRLSLEHQRRRESAVRHTAAPGVPARQARRAIREVVELLRDVGLLDDFYAAGATVAGLMVELFADVPADSPMFDQYSFISADDLPEFRAAGGEDRRPRHRRHRRRGEGAPAGAHVPDRRRAAPRRA